jgi:hypothetical protein
MPDEAELAELEEEALGGEAMARLEAGALDYVSRMDRLVDRRSLPST